MYMIKGTSMPVIQAVATEAATAVMTTVRM